MLDITDRIRKAIYKHKYIFLKKIGSGLSGKVYTARSVHDQSVYAIKVIKKDNHIWNKELEATRHIASKGEFNLVEIIENEEDVRIVMPYYRNSDLYNLLDNRGEGLPEKDALKITLQILKATENLHQAGYVHLDIKPENIMFDRDNNVVLIDFGCSEPFDKEVLDRYIGTSYYVAPEIDHFRFSTKTDVWSIGICFYVMIKFCFPCELVLNYNDESCPDYDQISDNVNNVTELSGESKSVLKRMLIRDFNERPSVSELIVDIENILK